MNKAMGFILLLLANMIILAHTILPHHHHDLIPVAVIVESHDHEGENNNHKHHDNPEPVEEKKHSSQHAGFFEDCLLNQTYIRSSINNQIGITTSFHFIPSFIAIHANDFRINITDYGYLPFRKKPFLKSFYSNLVEQSIGLRAPPYC